MILWLASHAFFMKSHLPLHIPYTRNFLLRPISPTVQFPHHSPSPTVTVHPSEFPHHSTSPTASLSATSLFLHLPKHSPTLMFSTELSWQQTSPQIGQWYRLNFFNLSVIFIANFYNSNIYLYLFYEKNIFSISTINTKYWQLCKD